MIFFLRFYSVKLNKMEENKFYKIYLGVMENEKKNMYKIFFLEFSSS